MKVVILVLMVTVAALFLTGCASKDPAERRARQRQEMAKAVDKDWADRAKAAERMREMSVEISREKDLNVHIKNLTHRNTGKRYLTVRRFVTSGSTPIEAFDALIKVAKKDREMEIRWMALTAAMRAGDGSLNITPALEYISENDESDQMRQRAQDLLANQE